MPGAEKIGAKKAGGGKLTKNPSQCLGPRDGSDKDRWGQTQEESESMPGAEKMGAT